MVDLPASAQASTARALADALWSAGLTVLQLRMKDASAAQMMAFLGELLASRPAGGRVVVNDRLDVALAGGADGVHLGQDDLPLAAARALRDRWAVPGFVIGISTHNEEQAAAAIDGGADYIALGPIFPTTSKRNPDPVIGVDRLATVCRDSPVPVVAIGGISLTTLPQVIQAGAHSAAIISAVNSAPDVRAAAQALQACFGIQR